MLPGGEGVSREEDSFNGAAEFTRRNVLDDGSVAWVSFASMEPPSSLGGMLSVRVAHATVRGASMEPPSSLGGMLATGSISCGRASSSFNGAAEFTRRNGAHVPYSQRC